MRNLNWPLTAGSVHDIGKLRIQDSIINKPYPLTKAEYRIICKHSDYGVAILNRIPQLKKCLPLIKHHHEWYDGGGYPDGLKGTEIPLGARILALADAYDAMTTERPYRRALPVEEARKRIARGLGQQFDPQLGRQFLKLVRGTGKDNLGLGELS